MNDEYGTWKEIRQDGASIKVSNLGYVMHYNNKKGRGWSIPHKPKQNAYGYRRFRVAGVNLSVHWCVCTAFLGPGNPDQTPDHMNGDKGDNRPENLRWATRREQQLNRKQPHTLCSARTVILRRGGEERAFDSSQKAAAFLQCAPSTVRQAASRPGSWKCKGWHAFYEEPAETQSDLAGEAWKQVTPTLAVSNMGRVQKWKGTRPQLRFTPTPDEGQPYCIVLTNKRLHRVIFFAFGGTLQRGETVDHVDQNSANNKLENLRAASASVQNKNKRHCTHDRR